MKILLPEHTALQSDHAGYSKHEGHRSSAMSLLEETTDVFALTWVAVTSLHLLALQSSVRIATLHAKRTHTGMANRTHAPHDAHHTSHTAHHKSHTAHHIPHTTHRTPPAARRTPHAASRTLHAPSLPTDYCPRTTAHALLPTDYRCCLRTTSRGLLPTDYCLRTTSRGLLPTDYTAHGLPPADYCYCLLPSGLLAYRYWPVRGINM